MEKKNHEVRVKYAEEEYKKVEKKASLLGMNVSSFIRTISLIANISTETPT